MDIKINGKQETLQGGATINNLLAARKIRPEVVTVELNGTIIARQDYNTILKEGDTVELVFYMGGGIIPPPVCQPKGLTLAPLTLAPLAQNTGSGII